MTRYRRLRQSEAIRNLVRETTLTKDDLIQPLFVVEGRNKAEAIESMPGIERYSSDVLVKEVGRFVKLGGQGVLLFGIPGKKDAKASQAYIENGVVQKAVRALKKEFPELVVMTDVCLCAYTNHGHCGVLRGKEIDNDATLPLLSKMAVSHAAAGADFVAPSDMMDFRVRAIREELDQKKFTNTGILSYAVKYSSAYYGPFREAAHSAPSFGNRKTYQMDPGNIREALKEVWQDITEGTDMVMVKPALAYLDVICELRRCVTVPVVAYSVSGEYSMIKAAAQKKWVNEKEIVLETLLSMKRAGASAIITYHAAQALRWLER